MTQTRYHVLGDPNYQPELLVADLEDFFNVCNASQVAKKLKISPSVLSKFVNQLVPLSDSLIVTIIEATGWTLSDIKGRVGIATNQKPNKMVHILKDKKHV